MSTNAETLQRFVDLVLAGSIEDALGLLAPDVVTREADSLPYGGDFHGCEGFARLLQEVFGIFELEFPEVQLADAGDTVIAEMQARLIPQESGPQVNRQQESR